MIDGNSTVSTNNWSGGIQPKYTNALITSYLVYKSDTVFPAGFVTTQSADSAYLSVLAGSGAILPHRDSVDLRIVNDVMNGTAAYGSSGLIDSQYQVGGWPAYLSSPASPDSDHDGMPDDWETANGLNPYDASDRNTYAADGYTMLEEYVNSIAETHTTTGVPGSHAAAAPEVFSLSQNYPNPFNPATNIVYTVPRRATVKITVYNILGKEVAVLVNGEKFQGTYNVEFNGNAPASGVYFVSLKSNAYSTTRKILLLK
jgi:hypothetical protein